MTLAEFLEIPVMALSAFRAITDSGAQYFLDVEPKSFSAVTVFQGSRRVVVHNDAHSRQRQRSNICHELSHGLLLHQPLAALNNSGCRDWDQTMEDEAQWLAGNLLITDAAAVAAIRHGGDEVTLAAEFDVSASMALWRINMSGARRRATRRRR